jgi:hypothetical protein
LWGGFFVFVSFQRLYWGFTRRSQALRKGGPLFVRQVTSPFWSNFQPANGEFCSNTTVIGFRRLLYDALLRVFFG